MSLLVAENVSLYFGERAICENFSFLVAAGDRIGLLGRNGSGKTSLMRLIMGELAPSAGDIRITRGVKLGYVAQDVTDLPEGSLLSMVLSSVPGKMGVEADIEAVTAALEASRSADEQEELGRRLSNLYETREHFDTLYAPHQAERILLGLGFSTKDYERPLGEFSGGWRTRAALAGLLYQKPDILLMDEPTNHLDVDTVQWLSKYLAGFDRALVLVSHDREFLNRHVNRVVSFESEGIRQYRGNYEEYLTQRAEEEKVLERAAANQEQKVKDAMKFVERFRFKATKARQAQSKLKLVEKMELVKTYKTEKTIDFSFPAVAESGRNVVTLDNVGKSFGDNILYKGLGLTVEKGDRVAIIGKNGAGKTTLLKIIAHELAPDQGAARHGHNVAMSYYAQHQAEQLNFRNTVVEEVSLAAPGMSQTFIRSVLGAFLFSGDEADKQISVLSGGEKARVALAKLLVRPGNLLLMDEPTNHLDIFASEKLTKALADYKGTLVFVSHNLGFANRLATKIWDIRGKGVEQYPGNLKEYLDHLERQEKEGQVQAAPQAEKAPEVPAEKPGPRADKKAKKREEAQKRQELSRVLAPLRERIRNAEKKISRLETREAEITTALSDPDVFADAEKSKALLSDYHIVRAELDRLLFRWEKDSAKAEEISASFSAEGRE
ncbi:MAG: ABC-F family ATP-binding cassette domain-containing protein [Thermodesulfobacteriota bacterium]